MTQHLLTLHTRTPLHVGSGASVEVVDQPIMRERITHFPIIPGSALKGVLRDHARHTLKTSDAKRDDALIRLLFGEDQDPDEEKGIAAHAGCLQFMEAKLLAYPVRSLAGCFAWLTCPTALQRFQRDTGKLVKRANPKDPNGKLEPIQITALKPDEVMITTNSELKVTDQDFAVFEEYVLKLKLKEKTPDTQLADGVAGALLPLCADSLWTDFLSQAAGHRPRRQLPAFRHHLHRSCHPYRH